MRRVLIGAFSTAALVLTSMATATAVGTTRVDGDHFAASDIKIADRGCLDPSANADQHAAFRIAKGPKQPPYGTRSIGWAPSESGFGDGPTVHVSSPSTVTGTQIRVFAPGDHASGQSIVDFVPNGDTGLWRGRYVLPADSSTGWHAINVATPSYQWRHYDATGTADQDAPNATLADFVAAHGGDAQGARIGFIFGCDGNAFYVDGLSVASADGNKIYDFEGYRTRTLLNKGSKTPSKITIDYGKSVRLTALLRQAVGGRAMAGKLRLDSRALSSKKWTKHQSFKVARAGHQLKVYPSRNSAYHAKYAGNAKYEASGSKVLKILVRSKVKAGLVDATVTKGKTFTTTGRVLPGRAAKVVLQHYVHKQWKAVKSGRSGRDGRFRVSLKASTVGTSYWRIKVGNGGGTVGNSSSAMKLTTKAPPSTGGGGGGGTGGGGSTPPPPPPSDPPPPPPPPPPTH
ncbi:hypothetical protein [Nocardioides panaciterrulae]|uniref:Uncharacterized protein n=1 Tax=Nocardioides panaciterrulae TaxID=661492 RepID=A0A7Y9E821_9ACTN|nr:hypothetical protein [Nocardioides panaciterrulae]NYD42839.1 hypothetical protein [Nocardioides panaciterrulae]